MLFEGYRLKGSVHKTIFRGIAPFQFFLLHTFPSYRPLKKLWVDSPTAVSDRVQLARVIPIRKCVQAEAGGGREETVPTGSWGGYPEISNTILLQ